jgi:chemotaxis signal transduction protein
MSGGTGVGRRNAVNTIEGTAAALRCLFDSSFAAAVSSMTEPLEDLLAIRVGADPYALRLSEIVGLYADVKIVPVPSPVVQLLGIASLRGKMAPVYDLAALLHYRPAASPRWMILAGAPQPVGFAFGTFEAHLQVSKASLADGEDRGEGSGATRRHVRGVVHTADVLRPMIHVASVLRLIRDNNS